MSACYIVDFQFAQYSLLILIGASTEDYLIGWRTCMYTYCIVGVWPAGQHDLAYYMYMYVWYLTETTVILYVMSCREDTTETKQEDSKAKKGKAQKGKNGGKEQKDGRQRKKSASKESESYMLCF